MSHQANDDFHDEPREWSRYKNHILDYYLKPYLEKVKTLGRPILIVDMFAGRGRFRNGEAGSPVIIAERIRQMSSSDVLASVVCIERRPKVAVDLRKHMAEYRFAEVWEGNCLTRIDEIAARAANATVLLYVDPYEAAQLNLQQLSRVYRLIKQQSVEVLEVFMASAVIRHARQILALERQSASRGDSSAPLLEFMPEEENFWKRDEESASCETRAKMIKSSREQITSVVGGDYWEDIAAKELEHDEHIRLLVSQYRKRLSEWFRATMAVPIHASDGGHAPKYYMVFGSRYWGALDLMNDAACKVGHLQSVAWNTGGSLFGGASFDPKSSADAVIAEVRQRVRGGFRGPWNRLRWSIEEDMVGRFKRSEIDGAIRALIGRGEVLEQSETVPEEGPDIIWAKTQSARD